MSRKRKRTKQQKRKSLSSLITNDTGTAAPPEVVTNQFQVVTTNLIAGNHVRHETMDGVEYIVAPVAMLTVGVHNGSGGPILYEEAELSKTPESWNMKPLVVYHPTQNGSGISACSKDVIETQGVGIIMNASYDGKLRAEAWFNIEKVKKVDERVLNALEEGNMMEVSTGLFTDNEVVEAGVWNSGDVSEAYDCIARNFRPDHLAILPDQTGACSIADGGGLFQTNSDLTTNVLSHTDTHRQLNRLIEDKIDRHCWIADVFPTWFVYTHEGKLYRRHYTTNGDMIQLTNDPPEAVTPQTVYRTVDGTIIGNSTVKPTIEPPTENGNQTMTKAEKIAALIANGNTQWTDDHKDFLTNQSDDFVDGQMSAAEKLTGEGEGDGKTKTDPTPQPDPVNPNPQPVGNQNPQQPQQPQDFNTWLNTIPAEFRPIVQNGVAEHTQRRTNLIASIKQNGSKLTDNQLNGLDTQVLQDMVDQTGQAVQNHATAQPQQPYVVPPMYQQPGYPQQPTVPVQQPVANYAGAAGGVVAPTGAGPVPGQQPVINGAPGEDDGLDCPTMNFAE